jgi:hypothetical protein
MKEETVNTFILAQLGSGNQDGSGPDPQLQRRLLHNLKNVHLCKGGCKKYIHCKCACPRCGDTHKKFREGEWRRCKQCKKPWKAKDYVQVRPEDLAQDAGGSPKKPIEDQKTQIGGAKKIQHYTCTFCGKYKYIEDMLQHVQRKHLKDQDLKDQDLKDPHVKDQDLKRKKNDDEVEAAENVAEDVAENVAEKVVVGDEVADNVGVGDVAENVIQTLVGAGAQFYGKASDKMVKVPMNVKKWALYALKLKKMGFEGATETGWKRAKQLATKEYIPIEDLRYMRNWYARHIYTSYPGYKHWEDLGRPKDAIYHKQHAIQSWLTWGGNAGFRWVNSQKTIDALNSYFNKNYQIMKK